MDTMLNRREEQNRRKGFLTSVIIHTLLLAVLILPLLTYPDPPPGQEGILVNLGGDFGQGDENAPEGEATVEETTPEPQPEPEVEPEPVKEVVKEKPKEKPTPTPTKDVVKTEDPNAVALKKQKEEEERKRQEEARIKAQQEAEAKARAEAEAKAKALKDKLGGAFGGGEGSGKGETGQQGNQGSKDGDPNAKNLEGISTGAGQVGGGLGSRGVVSSPRIRDNSQKTGVVVMKVCVDASGNVVSADFTLAGSTTQDSQLRELARRNAMSWKFAKGDDNQCGTIRYEFKVQ
jgi:outer membrane biosynthesis protein TonB